MFQFLPVLFLSCLISMLRFDALHPVFSCKCRFHILCVFQQRKKDLLVPCEKRKKLKNPNIIMLWHSILMKVTDGYSFCYPITADVQPRCTLYECANGAEPFSQKLAAFLQQLSVKYFFFCYYSVLRESQSHNYFSVRIQFSQYFLYVLLNKAVWKTMFKMQKIPQKSCL